MNRILIIGFTPPEEGGSERHIYEISKRIENQKVLTQKGSICKNKIQIPFLNNNSILRNFSFAIACFFYSFTLMFGKKKYDIIHIHENLLYFLSFFLRFRYKIVITVHGIKGFKFFDSKFLWFFFKSALNKASVLIAVNKEDQKLLSQELRNKKIIYVPNGADLEAYRQVNAKPEKKITFIGRIHEQKGITYLLEAFKLIENKNPKYKLEIIGEINDYAKELQKKFPSKNIIWKGYLSDRKSIISSLKSSYCIVLPSLWEGLPLTLFESLASDRPVIVSDIPAFKSVLKDEVLFSKKSNPQDIARQIEKLIQNVKIAEELAKKGELLSREYDWKNISERTKKIYEGL